MNEIDDGSTLHGPPEAEDTARIVRRNLETAAAAVRAEGLPVPTIEGKLLRPLVAYAFVPPEQRTKLDRRFWFGALAIQMVHEASLLHDDIVDQASERRGRPTLHEEGGLGPALIQGDHYLTAAYSVALKTGSVEFVERFIHSVERTVAGEIKQARAVGTRLDARAYQDIVAAKSGELLGAAACLFPAMTRSDLVGDYADLGRRIGALYQRVDDLLDFCTLRESGKPPLQDYRHANWTWVLDEAQLADFAVPESEVLELVFGRSGALPSVAERCLDTLASIRDQVVAESNVPGGCPHVLRDLMDGWVSTARVAVEAQSGPKPAQVSSWGMPSAEAVVFETAWRAGDESAWRDYFTSHARTFSLAARLFPPGPLRRVEGLYAYCRVTDNLVDDPIVLAPADVLAERLEIWRALSEAAYQGDRTGIPVLDSVMTEAARAQVDWHYPDALLDGVGLDLTQAQYEDWEDLERYTYGVAASVGGWMTQLFGLRDPETLARAHALGHALQLTNIARDVGEDLLRGRVYLPQVLMEGHGFSSDDLSIWKVIGGPLPANYASAMEELMAVADTYYETAGPGIAELPGFFRRPVAVAASAYRGIGQEIRRNGYDNLNLRAYTRIGTKLFLGARGLLMATRRRRQRHAQPAL